MNPVHAWTSEDLAKLKTESCDLEAVAREFGVPVELLSTEAN
jgi:hypothetical protein